ncbi:MAG: adenine deaminase [Desulfobacteraceae bacterium]|nr:MAG: adenine deaminase [Desulfobacteraceae bacterium]
MSISETKELMNTALGIEKADLVVLNGTLLNVYTGEFIDKCSVSVKGEKIAYVGGSPEDGIGNETIVIDAAGRTIIPGFIDGHAHIAWLYNISEFLKYVIPGGTTTIVTESMEIFPVSGYAGLLDFLDSLQDQPVKIFATAPAMVSISGSARGVPGKMIRKILARKDILGLGETYWQSLLHDPDYLLSSFEETLAAGKKLEGHSAGAGEKKLSAYVAAGITSCHEPINAKEVTERLRLGLCVMIREGSIRRDLETISRIKETGISLRRLALVTDGVTPKDLIEKGYMEYVVQKAIDCGFDPVTAVQMATLNVAEHFSIDNIVGGIAPGRYADMLILPGPRIIRPDYVISKGKILAEKGKLLSSPREHRFSEESRNSINLPRKLKADDFEILCKKEAGETEVRVIDQITGLVTKEARVVLPVKEAKINADTSIDVIKVAAIDRKNNTGKIFTGLLRGFKMKSGAIASSAAWDTSDIIVVGADDSDMAFAVNRIKEIQGGCIVCDSGKILAELPLPIFGIISDTPAGTLAAQMEEVNKAAAALGIPFSDPMLTLVTLTGAAIPYLRICEEGLVNLKDGKPVSLFV